MNTHSISDRQQRLWIFAGASAPLAMLAPTGNWAEAALAGAFSILLYSFFPKRKLDFPKWIAVLQWGWIALYLGVMTQWIDESWQTESGEEAIAAVLLLLAVLSSTKGYEKAAQVGALLGMFLMIIYGVIMIFGAVQIELPLLKVDRIGQKTGLGAIYLLPALRIVTEKKEKGNKTGLLLCIFGVLISVMVVGSLSETETAKLTSPYNEWVKGISIGQIAERFEAIASVGLTMGWFALFSYLLSGAGNIAKEVKVEYEKPGMWICGGIAAGISLMKLPIELNMLETGCILVWIVIPAAEMGVEKLKEKKNKKGT